ncbi:MAG TPA: thiamine pyrophosphate-dependent dehydrogenase E1 component subunit alpha, partial [Candidatus Acidoferrales bacterium]|nr:thiamine pyrophosphate-dependent dehydrogenase E1 component subunit alpha [Candidatus Acidoferrales bacterium]
WIAPMIRNVGALLVRGFRPRDIYTQYMARYTSPTQGKDGTSHFGDLEKRHVVSPISMLGDLIPVMTGVAMAGRYLGQNIVSMTWIGDGGSSTGAFHEGMNLAASQKAPFICVIENNQWAYSTPVNRQVPLRDLADRARAYGIPSYIVDGNDALAVYRTTREAVDRCRAGEGPVIIEAKTMRMRGHAQHDPAEYVPKEMFAYWKERDPLERFEKHLNENNLWDAKSRKAIEERIDRELVADLEEAENAPFPPAELAEQGVYCEGCHTIAPKWNRAIEEVSPPRSSAASEWKVSEYGGFEAKPDARYEALNAAAETIEVETPGALDGGNGSARARKSAASKSGGANSGNGKPSASTVKKSAKTSKVAAALPGRKGRR